MSLVIAENISMAFSAEYIFKNVSFRLAENDRVGLVGPNGEGKSTLLRILAGSLEHTDGQLHRSKGLTMAYLPQDPPALEGTTVEGAMLAVFEDIIRLEKEIHELSENLHDDSDVEKLGELQTRFETLGGYDYHNRIERILDGLAFDEKMRKQKLTELSGGQRTRAYLATLLLRDPDVLMLDEPTNHLDIDTTQWLEQWLKTFGGVLVVVSHDRYFLDAVTNSTWEVCGGGVDIYKGSYSEYLPKRQARYEEKLALWKSQQEYIAKTRDFIARFIAGQRTKEAQGRRSKLERFLKEEAIDKPTDPTTMSLKLRADKRSGDIVMRAEDISVGYDKPLVESEKLEVFSGQRIAIVGPNGCGKTTLLRSLLGELDQLGGEIKFGANVEFGYLSQTHSELLEDDLVVDSVMRVGATRQDSLDMLGSLQLGGEASEQKISELSGGQRSRVILARLALMNHNLLMLDEPTNHLDMVSCEILQKALGDFTGSVIFVSHDRYLIQNVATDIWIVNDGKIKAIQGSWDDYLAWVAKNNSAQAVAEATPQAKEQAQEKAARKQQYEDAKKHANLLKRLQRQHGELEQQIDVVEAQLEELNEKINDAGVAGDLEAIEKLGNEYAQAKANLDDLWSQWEHVGEQLEQHA